MSYPVGVTPNFNQYPSVSYQGVSTPVSPQMYTMNPNFAGGDVYVPGQQQEDDGLGVVGTTVAIGAAAAGLFALAKKGKLGGAAKGWANNAWNTVKGGFDKMSSTVKGWFKREPAKTPEFKVDANPGNTVNNPVNINMQRNAALAPQNDVRTFVMDPKASTTTVNIPRALDPAQKLEAAYNDAYWNHFGA